MIEDIETFRSLIPTVTGNSLDKYLQPIEDARAWLAGRIIGQEWLAEIEAMERTSPLFLQTRLALAYKAYLLGIPMMDVVETDNGFAVVASDTLAPASRDRVAALTTAMAENLNRALEHLVESLQLPQHRDRWQGSPAGTATAFSFFSSLQTFRLYSTFTGGYVDYLEAQPSLRRIILQHIEPRISRELSRQIIGQVQAGELSPANEEIIEDLRLAAGSLFNGDAPAGESALCRVREALEANPENFPAFENSVLYRCLLQAAARKPEQGSIYVML